MNKTVMAILVGLIAVIGIAAVVLTNRTEPQQAQQPESSGASTPPPAVQTDASFSEQASSEPDAESTKINIQDFAFDPQEVTVEKGSTVVWTNSDNIQHNVVPDNPSADFRGSELLSRGQTYEWTFDTPGTYTYHCGPHPNMTGKITVE